MNSPTVYGNTLSFQKACGSFIHLPCRGSRPCRYHTVPALILLSNGTQGVVGANRKKAEAAALLMEKLDSPEAHTLRHMAHAYIKMANFDIT